MIIVVTCASTVLYKFWNYLIDFFSSTLVFPFLMPPKKHKNFLTSSGSLTQGHVAPHVVEAVTKSDDEFEHLAVDAEDQSVKLISLHQYSMLMCFYFVDSIDKEAFEISDNEDDDDELAIIPHSIRIGPPRTPSPVKALLVFYFTFIITIFFI